jgi:hypothetical protein
MLCPPSMSGPKHGCSPAEAHGTDGQERLDAPSAARIVRTTDFDGNE